MNKVDYSLVGRKVREKRMELGYSQEQLAELCHISTSYLGHIERGTRKLSMESAVKLSFVLHVSLDYLLLDAIPLNDSTLNSISSELKNHSSKQVDKFLSTVKILAENIDKM